MTVVDLHPEELFDNLRAGRLAADARERLLAHCSRCKPCQFELLLIEDAPSLSLEDEQAEQRGAAALHNLALPRSVAVQPRGAPQRRSLMAAAAAIAILGTTFGVAAFFTRGALVREVSAWLTGEARQPTVRTVRPVRPAAPAPVPAALPEPAPEPAVSVPAGVEAAAPLQPEAAAEADDNGALTRRGHRQSRRRSRRARAVRLAAPEQTAAHGEISGAADPEAELAAATLARSRGELEQAAQRYRSVIEHHPASRAAGAAQVALGRLLYTELGQPSAALDVLTGYLNRAGDTALTEEVLYYRGLCLQDQGRAAEARESFSRLLAQFPASLYAPRARAKLAQLTD